MYFLLKETNHRGEYRRRVGFDSNDAGDFTGSCSRLFRNSLEHRLTNALVRSYSILNFLGIL